MRGLNVAILAAALAFGLPAPSPAREHDQEEWLIVPQHYTPQESWPFILASQNQIADLRLDGPFDRGRFLAHLEAAASTDCSHNEQKGVTTCSTR